MQRCSQLDSCCAAGGLAARKAGGTKRKIQQRPGGPVGVCGARTEIPRRGLPQLPSPANTRRLLGAPRNLWHGLLPGGVQLVLMTQAYLLIALVMKVSSLLL
jgi:hypothetical protein